MVVKIGIEITSNENLESIKGDDNEFMLVVRKEICQFES